MLEGGVQRELDEQVLGSGVTGKLSAAGLFVRRVWSEPSAFMTYISPLPSRAEVKEICVPLGDQAG